MNRERKHGGESRKYSEKSKMENKEAERGKK